MEHYFTHEPSAPPQEYTIETVLRGNHLTFFTSTGVFSKRKIDYGTCVLIETVDVNPGDDILDLGCGYGPIGIGLSFFCHNVTLLDINKRACTLAYQNIIKNKVHNAHVICGTPSCVDYPFQVVTMNPPIRAGKDAVHHLIEESHRLLTPAGTLYLVVRTRQGAKSLYTFVKEIFSQAEYAAKQGGYRVIAGSKGSE
ncbi:MAG: methyltransferase [Candidatus Methanofastidiosia archaeon]|jgi:16S rRNA (guanine1207-N2)-methyltransferase